jgi:diadenylate cyclase
VEEEATLIIKDYLNSREKTPAEVLGTVLRAFEEEISDSVFLARSLGLGTVSSHLEQSAAPRGYRMLHKIPRIPPAIIENLVEEFAMLNNIMRASIEELDEVEGIGEVRAHSIKNGLMRMREQFLLEYMV